jgi:hypothetical protein
MLQVIVRVTRYNRPEIVVDQTGADRILETADIQGGKYTNPDGINIVHQAYPYGGHCHLRSLRIGWRCSNGGSPTNFVQFIGPYTHVSEI